MDFKMVNTIEITYTRVTARKTEEQNNHRIRVKKRVDVSMLTEDKRRKHEANTRS